MKRYIKALLILTVTVYGYASQAQEIVEVTPLTNRVLMVHVDEGDIDFSTNTINKEKLNITLADSPNTYTLSSTDDAEYESPEAPARVGRKTKGTEYARASTWAGDHFDPRNEPWISEHWIYLEFDKAMINGKNYTLNTGAVGTNKSAWSFVYDEKQLRSESVHVNTIGYAPDAPKYGYIYQWMGSLGSLDLNAYAGNTFWIYEESDLLTPVKTGAIAFRKSATNAETSQPNDTPNKNFLSAEVYEADFTDVSAAGTYILVVEGIGKSYPFKIGSDPIWEPYYRTMRAIYHQRSGIRIEANYYGKPYIRPVTQNPMVTDAGGTSFQDKLLYSKVPFTSWTSENGGTANALVKSNAEGNVLDVAGWYQDAGDWDAYYTHQRIPMMLMTTFEHVPTRFGDDELDIPESGNGIPDIIDEASWLVKFNYRLRKESKAKGYSDGGVGGARVAPDPYTTDNNNPEADGKPSWQETRKYAVSQADAFMTYMYAGEAAQLAIILKKLGRDPKKHPVEMLDAIAFEDMTYDEVNFIKEAEESFLWASKPENQPQSNNNYNNLVVYKTYAAVNLYRLTGKSKYQEIAEEGLQGMLGVSSLDEDQRYAAYTYILADNYDVDEDLKLALISVTEKTAKVNGVNAAEARATRWGGNFSFPMLIGQATTPWMFDNVVAYAVTGKEIYKNVVHTTCDYFLGTNPLHTTWMTGVGPRPISGAFNLDARVISDNWETYPGWISYGPWIHQGQQLFTYEMPDGITRKGGPGQWSSYWMYYSVYPTIESWPGHEQQFDNIHTPFASENTVHQQSVKAAVSYGFANSRSYSNAGAAKPLSALTLDSADFTFNYKYESAVLIPTLNIMDATFSTLKWSTSDASVVDVDQYGRVTAIGNGTAQIVCQTLDGSVSTSITITCDNLTDLPVSKLEVDKMDLQLSVGSSQEIFVTVIPDKAVNKNYTWTSSNPSIATIENDVITAVASGETTLTVTADGNSAVKTIISVKVIIDAVGIAFVGELPEILAVGKTVQLEAAVSPANAENTDVVWSSSNTAIATVSPSGLVTGIAKGSVRISATSAMDNSLKVEASIVVAEVLSGELEKLPVELFPNPTRDFINIKFIKGISQINVYDISSQRIKSVSLNNVSSYQLNMSEFRSATYILQLSSAEGKVSTYRFIKK